MHFLKYYSWFTMNNFHPSLHIYIYIFNIIGLQYNRYMYCPLKKHLPRQAVFVSQNIPTIRGGKLDILIDIHPIHALYKVTISGLDQIHPFHNMDGYFWIKRITSNDIIHFKGKKSIFKGGILSGKSLGLLFYKLIFSECKLV